MIDDRTRFLLKVKCGDGCWLWTASTKGGYGLFWLNGRMNHANRASWIIFKGAIPVGLCVLHRCDNPLCVNPEHLFLGTQAENNLDRKNKGRSATGDRSGSRLHPETTPRGRNHPRAKMTEEIVAEARQLFSEGIPTGQLAARFGVKGPVMSNAIHGRIWRHVPGAIPVARLRHGTRSRYDAGCRCEKCGTARAVVARRHYENKRKRLGRPLLWRKKQ